MNVGLLGFGLDVLIIWLVVGFFAGILANAITRRTSTSALTDVLLGIMGAGVGNILLNALGFYSRGGLLSSVVAATFGAVVLIWFYRRFLNQEHRA